MKKVYCMANVLSIMPDEYLGIVHVCVHVHNVVRHMKTELSHFSAFDVCLCQTSGPLRTDHLRNEMRAVEVRKEVKHDQSIMPECQWPFQICVPVLGPTMLSLRG